MPFDSMTGGAVASVRRDFHLMNDCDCVIIGAGVVGLAIARAIAQTGFEVIVLESASSIGSGTSSRNSEVIHAGIYYPAGTLKARLCVDGKRMLYDYVQARGIDHRRCGKLVVATHEAQIDRLHQLIEHAKGAGVDDLRLLDAGQARALEPSLQCVAAVLSPSTGIIDSHAFMLGLQGDIEHAGGMVVLCSPVEQVQQAGNGFVVQVAEGGSIRSRLLVNAAGLSAPALAMRIDGLDPACVPDAYWAKGSYFSLAGRAPFDRLVYPVPESGGLGVHLTLDMGGQARFGPDVEWVDAPGDYRADPERANGFYAEIRKYWPGLPEGALQPAYAGIRPKICGPEQPTADFMIQGADEHGMDGLVNLFGIESPGLTSALAIAGLVAQKLRVAP